MYRRVEFLIYPGFQLLDAAGPVAAFETAERYRPGSYSLRIVAAQPGLVASSSGVCLPASPFGRANRIDTLVISGGDGTRTAATCLATRRFVLACARSTRRVATVCSGTYVLAAAGILDGKSATTHWSRSADFSRRFPKVPGFGSYIHKGRQDLEFRRRYRRHRSGARTDRRGSWRTRSPPDSTAAGGLLPASWRAIAVFSATGVGACGRPFCGAAGLHAGQSGKETECYRSGPLQLHESTALCARVSGGSWRQSGQGGRTIARRDGSRRTGERSTLQPTDRTVMRLWHFRANAAQFPAHACHLSDSAQAGEQVTQRNALTRRVYISIRRECGIGIRYAWS
jgi:putative intracellular protease/amidase